MTVEAVVSIGSYDFSLNDVLVKLIHVRGFGHSTSYCIIDLSHAQTELLLSLMNREKIKIRYGRDGNVSDQFEFEILYTNSRIELTQVAIRIVGVEPGFNKLTKSNKIKGYAGHTVSSAISLIASNLELSTDLQSTSGKASLLQTNLTDLQFILNYLLPIAIDSSGNALFLFTIDNNKVICRVPVLSSKPTNEYIILPNTETEVKRFLIRNIGILSDFMVGGSHKSYSYDPVMGSISYSDTMENVANELINEKGYVSSYSRIETLPYEKKWMLKAHTKSRLVKSNFIIDAYALLDGDLDLNFDQVNRFSIPLSSGEHAEYSGNYYTQDIINILRPNLFQSHLRLISNAFRIGKTE